MYGLTSDLSPSTVETIPRLTERGRCEAFREYVALQRKRPGTAVHTAPADSSALREPADLPHDTSPRRHCTDPAGHGTLLPHRGLDAVHLENALLA
jgi:hypothetical protein